MLKKISLIVAVFIFLSSQNVLAETMPATKNDVASQTVLIVPQQKICYEDVKAIDVVNNPSKYLGKYIRINGIFDKFSVVGLDYKPALRKADDYIAFLIRKTEISGHIIPLAEMKLFITRKDAEKYIDLESGDKIEFTGRVFATALGDPWIDVDNIKILTPKKAKADTKEKNVDEGANSDK